MKTNVCEQDVRTLQGKYAHMSITNKWVLHINTQRMSKNKQTPIYMTYLIFNLIRNSFEFLYVRNVN